MTEEATTSGVESTQSSGQTDGTSGPEVNQTQEDLIPHSTYKKVLSEKRNLAERLKQIEDEAKKKEEVELEKQGEYQKINESLKVKLKETEEKYE